MVNEQRTIDVIVRWERIACRKFHDAEQETDCKGRRLIEHGAMCYVNCARDLREALTVALPGFSATEATNRTLLMRLVSRLCPWLFSKWSHPLQRRGNRVPST